MHSGDQVRITAQFIYAPQDKSIWAQSYEPIFRISWPCKAPSQTVGRHHLQLALDALYKKGRKPNPRGE